MEWLKENWFRLSIIGALLLVTYPVYYHYVIYIPAKAAEEDLASTLRIGSRRTCIRNAERSYRNDWANECDYRKEKDCRLPGSTADSLEKRLYNAKEMCYKEHPL